MSRGLLCATLAAATRIRGVNLGGWLVLEPWILPNFFETANEILVAAHLYFTRF